MVSPGYEGVEEKLRRAKEHLRALHREQVTYMKGEPYTSSYADEGDWKLWFFKESEKPPLRLGVILGDVIHNLRSALDHVVWQLVIANDKRPGRHNAFPIYVLEKDWDRQVEDRHSKKGRGPLWGVSDTTFTRIKEMQPFVGRDENTAKRQPLALLNHLSVRDKHQTIPIGNVLTADNPPGIDVVPREGVVQSLLEWSAIGPGTPLKDGIEIARARLFVDRPDIHMDVKFHFSADIAFGDRRVGWKGLNAIAAEVGDIVTAFAGPFHLAPPPGEDH